MSRRSIGVIMNGVTGRMGSRDHLARSIMAIRTAGGVRAGSHVLWPEPILVGRDADRLQALCAEHRLERWSTDLDATLSDPNYEIYFDAQTTIRREAAVKAAIAAGRHVYVEKPAALSSSAALAMAVAADAGGVRHGVVQDKLFLPGMLQLARLIEEGFFGRIFSVRGEFGYWVFDDIVGGRQRPSWNYRAEDGGGIVLDMYAHWRYLFDALFGGVKALVSRSERHVPTRTDEAGRTYTATADDAAYAIFELGNGAIAHFVSSWCVRPYRDDLFVLQVDGERGSALATLRDCKIQPASATPVARWNPTGPPPELQAGWITIPPKEEPLNAFRVQWEHFLRHVAFGEPYAWTLEAGARAIQLAELAQQSSVESRWVDVPDLVS